MYSNVSGMPPGESSSSPSQQAVQLLTNRLLKFLEDPKGGENGENGGRIPLVHSKLTDALRSLEEEEQRETRREVSQQVALAYGLQDEAAANASAEEPAKERSGVRFAEGHADA